MVEGNKKYRVVQLVAENRLNLLSKTDCFHIAAQVHPLMKMNLKLGMIITFTETDSTVTIIIQIPFTREHLLSVSQERVQMIDHQEQE